MLVNYNSLQNKLPIFSSFLTSPPPWPTYIHKISLRLARSNVLEKNRKLWILYCKSKENKRNKVTLVSEEIESFHKDKKQ